MAKGLFIPIDGVDANKLIQGAKRAVERLKNIFKEGFASIKDYSTLDSDEIKSNNIKELVDQYEQLRQTQKNTFEEQKQELKEIQAQQKLVSDGLQKMSKESENANKELIAAQTAFRERFGDSETRKVLPAEMEEFTKLKDNIESAKNKVAELAKHTIDANLESAMLAEQEQNILTSIKSQPEIIKQNSVEFRELLQSAGLTVEKADELATKFEKGKISATELTEQIKQLKEELKVEKSNSLIGTIGGFIGGAFKGTFGLLGGGLQKAGGLFKKLFSNITKGAKQGGMSIKRMMMAMLGARSLFTIISKATHAYMATNEELNEKLQGIWNSLGELIGPVIEYLINLIVKLFGYVNSFVQALTGINMVANANAKALKKQAEAQKGLNAQTAAFDEMNKLSDGGDKSAPQLEVPDFNIDVGGVGKDIADKFNEFIDSIDWEELGKQISDGLIYAMNQAIDLLEGVDWQKFGQNIAKFIAAIDWTTITENIFRIFGDILGGLAGFIWGLMSNAWEKVKEYFAGYIERAKEEFPNNMFGLAGNIIDGLLMGIIDALANIWSWIKEHIFKPFIEGFKAAFGISSPSKVMEEQGQYIIDGLYQGLLGIWDAVKGIFQNLVLNILRKFSEILFGENNFLTEALTDWDSFKEMLSQTVDNIKTSIITKWDAIKTAIQDKWNSIKQGAVDAWNAIKNTFSPVVNWFREKFSGAWNAVKSIFSDKGDVFKGIQEGISTTFKNIVNKLIDGINKVVSWPFTKINNMLNNIKSVSILGIKPFDNLWGWSPISVPSIPRLAQGAVIPPNKEFMAILGDQKSGTNIEAPLDTIVDAFRQVLAENNGQAIELTVKLDGKTLSKELTRATKKLDFSYNRG